MYPVEMSLPPMLFLLPVQYNNNNNNNNNNNSSMAVRQTGDRYPGTLPRTTISWDRPFGVPSLRHNRHPSAAILAIVVDRRSPVSRPVLERVGTAKDVCFGSILLSTGR